MKRRGFFGRAVGLVALALTKPSQLFAKPAKLPSIPYQSYTVYPDVQPIEPPLLFEIRPLSDENRVTEYKDKDDGVWKPLPKNGMIEVAQPRYDLWPTPVQVRTRFRGTDG